MMFCIAFAKADFYDEVTVVDCGKKTTITAAFTEPSNDQEYGMYSGYFKFHSVKAVPVQISITSDKPIFAVFQTNAHKTHDIRDHMNEVNVSGNYGTYRYSVIGLRANTEYEFEVQLFTSARDSTFDVKIDCVDC
eukprot:174336_1